MIVFLKHIGIEGPETLGSFLEDQGFNLKVLELQEGAALPESLDEIEAVVSLGGPMNVYEEDKYSFLKDEDLFLKKVLDAEIPFLGICLGSQLLAKACGAKVGKAPEKEVGFFPVRLTSLGKDDPLFAGLAGSPIVFQWHEDMWQLPAGARLLVSSEGCPHQAFRVGPHAYGLQFHVEVTASAIQSWADAYFTPNDSFRIQQKRVMIEDYRSKKELFHQTAQTVYNNLSKIITDHKNSLK